MVNARALFAGNEAEEIEEEQEEEEQEEEGDDEGDGEEIDDDAAPELQGTIASPAPRTDVPHDAVRVPRFATFWRLQRIGPAGKLEPLLFGTDSQGFSRKEWPVEEFSSRTIADRWGVGTFRVQWLFYAPNATKASFCGKGAEITLKSAPRPAAPPPTRTRASMSRRAAAAPTPGASPMGDAISLFGFIASNVTAMSSERIEQLRLDHERQMQRDRQYFEQCARLTAAPPAVDHGAIAAIVAATVEAVFTRLQAVRAEAEEEDEEEDETPEVPEPATHPATPTAIVQAPAPVPPPRNDWENVAAVVNALGDTIAKAKDAAPYITPIAEAIRDGLRPKAAAPKVTVDVAPQ